MQRVQDQIFEMVYYGRGGFTYEDMWRMPINLRSYYYIKLYDIMEAQKKAEEDAANNSRRRR